MSEDASVLLMLMTGFAALGVGLRVVGVVLTGRMPGLPVRFLLEVVAVSVLLVVLTTTGLGSGLGEP